MCLQEQKEGHHWAGTEAEQVASASASPPGVLACIGFLKLEHLVEPRSAWCNRCNNLTLQHRSSNKLVLFDRRSVVISSSEAQQFFYYGQLLVDCSHRFLLQNLEQQDEYHGGRPVS
jgi:hypothetical protein